MNKQFKLYLSAFVLMLIGTSISAQCIYNGDTQRFEGPDCPNAVQTAVPFLRITPDARSGGLGDLGIALSPDANSVFYNSAKLAFVEKDISLSASYTPWLRDLVKDIYLASIGGYKKIDDLQSIGFGLRYFNMGEINFINAQGDPAGSGTPNEFALDLAYARKLGDKLALGVNGRFVYSNLAGGQTVDNIDIKPGTAGAVDLSLFYDHQTKTDNELRIGLTLSNMGAKIAYTDQGISDYLPANLGIGAAYTLNLDEYNKLTFLGELNKLMVPTPSDEDVDPENGIPDYRELSVISSLFKSFGDAETSAEEFKEWVYQLGFEYLYDDQFAVRAGYFHEAQAKGFRQHFTLGLGLEYNILAFDLAYLINANGAQNPLNNTIRFTIHFDFGALNLEDEN